MRTRELESALIMTARQKIRLIANPVAGGNARREIGRAVDCLRGKGGEVSLVLTSARGDARQAAEGARRAGADLVVAAGGDGTLNEVINGLVPSEIPLGFIPLGTTNVFALEVGIPFDVERACRIVLEGDVRPVCLGAAGNTRFLLMAGIGFDAETVYRVSSRLKRLTGKFAYLASAVSALLDHPSEPLEVVAEDGRRLTGFHLIIGNGRFYGGRFSLTPGASLFEDSLECCLFRRPSRLGLIADALRVILGRPFGSPTLEHFKVRRLSVKGNEIPVQIDGDFLGRLPMEFWSAPGELRMVLPGNLSKDGGP